MHHVIAYTQPAGSPMSEDGALGPGNIGGVTPNKPGVVFEPGVGRLLTANSDIVLQMHYTTNGEADDRQDRRSACVFAKEPPKMQQRGGSVIQPRFVIPAGAPAHEVRGSRVLAADTMITSFTPHMHVRGKDMTYTAKYPDGRTETLLSVPKYDFNWQITYQLKEAEAVPEGHRDRSGRALRQLAAEQVQSRSDEGRPLGRPDVGRDDDRLLGHRRRTAQENNVMSRRAFLSMAGPPRCRRPGRRCGAAPARIRVAVQCNPRPAIDAARLRNRLERLSYHGRAAAAASPTA